MIPALVEQVECTNCGSSLELVVAVVAVLLALTGLAFSAAQYRMMRAEHEQFMRQQEGATVEVEIRPINRPGWELFDEDVGDLYFRCEVLIRAAGVDARDVAVHAVIAEGILARWAGPGGEDLGPGADHRIRDNDTIPSVTRGEGLPASWLERRFERIAPRVPERLYLQFLVRRNQTVRFQIRVLGGNVNNSPIIESRAVHYYPGRPDLVPDEE